MQCLPSCYRRLLMRFILPIFSHLVMVIHHQGDSRYKHALDHFLRSTIAYPHDNHDKGHETAFPAVAKYHYSSRDNSCTTGCQYRHCNYGGIPDSSHPHDPNGQKSLAIWVQDSAIDASLPDAQPAKVYPV